MADDTISLLLIGGQDRVPHRWCRRCGESKPLTEFEKAKTGRYRFICKTCRNLQHKAIYEESRDNLKKWVIIQWRTRRGVCNRKGTPFTITVDEIASLYDAQGGLCSLTNRQLLFGSRGTQRDSLSMDRINHKLGYVLGNVRLVTYQANMARTKFSDEELYAFCEAVLANRAGEARQ